jgi:hypothetical protein
MANNPHPSRLTPPARRVLAVGVRRAGANRWMIRTSLWRYLAATALGRS